MSQRIDRASCLNCSVLLHYSSICYESGGLSSGIFFLPHVWPLSFKASRAITQLHVLAASWEEEKQSKNKHLDQISLIFPFHHPNKDSQLNIFSIPFCLLYVSFCFCCSRFVSIVPFFLKHDPRCMKHWLMRVSLSRLTGLTHIQTHRHANKWLLTIATFQAGLYKWWLFKLFLSSALLTVKEQLL